MSGPAEQPQQTPSLQEIFSLLDDYGCHFFKLRHGAKEPQCKKGETWKRAHCPAHVRLSYLDAAQRAEDGGNVGVDPGPRIAIVDTDSAAADAKFKAAMPDLKPLLTIQSRDGFHYYICAPEDQEMTALGVVQTQGGTALGEKVDVKSHNEGYCVGPGSTVAGWRYKCLEMNSDPKPEAGARLNPLRPVAAPLQAIDGGLSDAGGLTEEEDGSLVSLGLRNSAIYNIAKYLFRDKQVSYEAVYGLIKTLTARFQADADGKPYAANHSEIASTVRSALHAADGKKGELRPAGAGARDGAYFHLDKRNPRQSFKNLLAAAGIQMAFNERDESIEIKRAEDQEWRRVKSYEVSDIREEVESTCRPRPEFFISRGNLKVPDKDKAGRLVKPPEPWRMGVDIFKDRLQVAAGRDRRDPVLLRLHEIDRLSEGGRNWQGKPIEEDYLFRSVFQFFKPGEPGADNLEAMKYLDPIIGCGIVKSAMEPGCAWSFTPALIGPVGIGKSKYPTCWLWNPETEFSDKFNFTPRDDKQAAEQVIGKVIIELPEAQAINRALSREQSDAVYAELTRRKINYRRPYLRLANEEYLYRFIFIITCNYPNVIPRMPGADNRRILPAHLLPVHEGKANVVNMINMMASGDRDKRLAQSLRWVREGKFDNMIDAIESLMKRLGPDHEAGDDILEGLLMKKLYVNEGDMEDGVSLLQIKERCMQGQEDTYGNKRPDYSHAKELTQQRIVRCLTSPTLGWERRRVGNAGRRRWFPPADWEERRK